MICTMGEMIVEIMRNEVDAPLNEAGVFLGPFPSGAPAIFIDTVAKLGHSAAIIGGVGKDDFGRCLTDRLTKDGVDCSLVGEYTEASTGCAFVTYFSDGGRKFIFHIGNTPAAMPKMPPKEKLPDADYFHVMGCSLMASEAFGREIVKTMHAFKEKGAKISFDPNIRPELLGNASLVDEVMAVTSVFQPGVSELLMISGCDTVEDAVKKCFENEILEIIALKNGSKGCRVFTRDGEFSQGIYEVEPLDATGAGDSFDGAFLVALAEGKDVRTAAKIASAAAALNTAAFGPMEGKISKESVAAMMAKGE